MTETTTDNASHTKSGWRTALTITAILAVFVGGFLVLIEQTAGTSRTTPSNAIAVGVVDGRNVAVVAYETDT